MNLFAPPAPPAWTAEVTRDIAPMLYLFGVLILLSFILPEKAMLWLLAVITASVVVVRWPEVQAATADISRIIGGALK